MANIQITVISGGDETKVKIPEGQTAGQTLGDSDFREDFNISNRAIPYVNGAEVQSNYVLEAGDILEPKVAASSKSNPEA